MLDMKRALTDLPDDAGLLCWPAEPALQPEAAAALVTAIDKLCQQFEREQRLSTWAVEVVEDGRFVLLAWQGVGEGMSGCRKDKLAKILALHAERSGSRLLDVPPIWVAPAGRPQGFAPAALRPLVAAGEVDAQTPAWNTMANDLGSWRAGAGCALGSIDWLAFKLQRWQATVQ